MTTGIKDRQVTVGRSSDQPTSPTAMLLMVGAGASFCMLDTSAKYLVMSGLKAEFVSWMRFLVHIPLLLLAVRFWKNAETLKVNSFRLQTLRALGMIGATFLNFLALATLRLDQAVAISFLAPIMITVFSGPLLGEWAGWRRWIAVLAGLVGVLVMIRPGFGSFETGHLYALGAMTSMSLYIIMTRMLGKCETAQSLTLYPALIAVVLLLPLIPGSAQMPREPIEWLLLLSLGLWGALGHYLVVSAHKIATAVTLAPFPYLGMIWAAIAGYLVFQQLPDIWTIAGAAIIIASGVFVVRREQLTRPAVT